MGEVASGPAHLPDPFVRLFPRVLKEAEYPALQRPRLWQRLEVVHATLVHGVEHLAVDVELELLACRVAGAHRRRLLIARQPAERDLSQAALTRDAVHDLERGRVAGGCAQEPDTPRARFV